MTFNRKSLLAALSLMLLISGYLFFQVDWEARAVRKQLDRLVHLVEKDGPVSTFDALRRSRQFSGLFTEESSVEYYPGRPLPRDPDALGAAFLSAWRSVDQASITVRRHDVQISDPRRTAESMLQAKCNVVLSGREPMKDLIKYRIYWRQVDGDWKIESMLPLVER